MRKINKILTVMLGILLFVGVAIPVRGAVAESTGGILESAGNVFIWDETCIDKNLESQGDVYALSNEVGLAGNIDGSIITVGNMINIKTTDVEGSIRAAGQFLSILSNDVKNITAIGTNITIEEGTVAKGVYLAGADIEFYGEANEVRVTGDTVVIKGKINGDLHVDCTSLIIEDTTEISGNVFVKASNRPIVKGDFDKDKINFERVENNYKEESFANKLIEGIPSIISAILISIILLVLFKNSIQELIESTENRLAATGFSGFATLIVLPIVSVICIFTIIGIPIAIISLIIYGTIIYLAPVIMAIFITEKYLKDMNKFIFVPIAVGVIKILSIVPIIGVIVYFICIIFSLGLLVFKIVNNIKNNY